MAARTKFIGQDWKQHAYYDKAEEERSLAIFWQVPGIFAKYFRTLNLDHLVELACGHGRHVQKYKDQANAIVLIDINKENIDFCKERYKDEAKISYIVNSGSDFSGIEDDWATSIFCYDAMVHFELMDVALYLQDAVRILRHGGKCLFHHSNYDRNPGAWYTENPHSRNFMNARIFKHLAMSNGLRVVSQQLLDWGGASPAEQDIDCLTLLQKD